jgi:protein required for attachment to host cells
MSDVRIRNRYWVVVCDGRKALVLENAGDAELLNLVTKETRQADNPSTHEQGVERPGRVHQSVGGERSAVEQTDWHDEAERTFLRELAARLDRAVAAGETKAIVLVAPPRAMGMLRAALSPRVNKAVKGEITKDYVMMPVSDIEKRLKA